jgi:hypothetical protein
LVLDAQGEQNAWRCEQRQYQPHRIAARLLSTKVMSMGNEHFPSEHGLGAIAKSLFHKPNQRIERLLGFESDATLPKGGKVRRGDHYYLFALCRQRRVTS